MKGMGHSFDEAAALGMSFYESFVDECERSGNWGDSLVTVHLSRASERESSCGSVQGAAEEKYETKSADETKSVSADESKSAQHEVEAPYGLCTPRSCGCTGFTSGCPFNTFAKLEAEREALYFMGLLDRFSRLPPV